MKQRLRKIETSTNYGITGQDGSYLAEFLIDKGYQVHGIKRRASLFNTDRIDHLFEDPNVQNKSLVLHHGDMTDSSSLTRILQDVRMSYTLANLMLPLVLKSLNTRF